MTRAVAIVGPTASGKSALALGLAERFHGAILNADSIQVYRGFDIGSAKPDGDERARVPHELIDIVDADQEFTAAAWASMARDSLTRQTEAGRLPFVVGGTGFYFRALFEGLIEAPGKNEAVRTRLEALATGELTARLQAVDPVRASQIAPNDRFRLIRALEIWETSGRTPSEWAAEQVRKAEFDVLWIGISPPREELYRRIDRRVEAMWRAGWVDEVRALVERGYGATRAMDSVGYREVHAFLQGKIAEPEAIALAQRRTRQYAKRQLTWFRANRHVHWFDPGQNETRDLIIALTARWLDDHGTHHRGN